MRDSKGRFVKGAVSWMAGKKGIHNSVETEFKKGIIPWNRGLDKTDPRVQKYVLANIKDRTKSICKLCGKEYFVIPSRESRTRFCSRRCVSLFLKSKYESPNSYNKTNHNQYIYLHAKIRKNFGKPVKCEICKDMSKKVYHWANKTGRYLEDRKDWISLCPKCHSRYDIERGIRKFVR